MKWLIILFFVLRLAQFLGVKVPTHNLIHLSSDGNCLALKM